MNTFDITLDLDKRGLVQVVPIRQGDKSGTTIRATITDHGVAASTSGMTARFQMRLPNGTEYYRKAASLSGNVATVTIDEAQAASAVGRTDVAYFQLLQGSTVVASTESFTVIVLPDALADATVPESYDSAIQDAIDALDDAVEQLPATVEDVLADHPEWTTTVQDGSIGKAKLATDLARDRERLLYRLDNLLTNALPEGETATATDAAQTPMAGLALYGRSTQDGTPTPSAPVPIVSVTGDSEGNISLWARGRNLLQLDDKTTTSKGITFAFGSDGSVHISGTATGEIGANSSYTELPAGTYTLSADTSQLKQINVYNSNGDRVGYTTNGQLTFTLTDAMGVRIYPIVLKDATVDVTIWPMLQRGTTATAYEPYTSTVTPIPLDGHELRSLPDGTRDEVTVDSRGHVTLVQRVGSVTLDGSIAPSGATAASAYFNISSLGILPPVLTTRGSMGYCNRYEVNSNFIASAPVDNRVVINASVFSGTPRIAFYDSTHAGSFNTWLQSNPVTLLYPLATPVTHDLGYVAAVPLCGPDLTAQAVPTAPFALTYERDLNVTLARLESAIANLV